MKPIETLQNTDAFSWQRTAMVGRYFRPILLKKLIGFFLLATIFYVAGCVCVSRGALPSTSATLFNLSTYILILSPLVFGARHDREIFKTLPALTDEKCTVIAVFCFILVPIAVLLPEFIVSTLASEAISTPDFHISSPSEAFDTILGQPGWLATAVIFNFTLFATCLWGVFALNNDKLYYTVLLVLVISFIIRTTRHEIEAFDAGSALNIFDSLLLLYGVLMMWKARKNV